MPAGHCLPCRSSLALVNERRSEQPVSFLWWKMDLLVDAQPFENLFRILQLKIFPPKRLRTWSEPEASKTCCWVIRSPNFPMLESYEVSVPLNIFSFFVQLDIEPADNFACLRDEEVSYRVDSKQRFQRFKNNFATGGVKMNWI